MSHDTLTIHRRACRAWFLGAAALTELHAQLALAGVDRSVEKLAADGEAFADLVGLNSPTRASCYVCGAACAPGTLCGCYQDVSPGRVCNVHSLTLLESLPAETVVDRFCCKDCGALTAVTAQSAATSHRKNGRYVERTTCFPCYKTARNQRKVEKRGKRAAQPVEGAVMLTEAPTVVPPEAPPAPKTLADIDFFGVQALIAKKQAAQV